MLAEAEWRAREAAHRARIDAWTAPVLARASRGEKHPIEDFLFGYYPHRPAQLRRWSPGRGVVLAGGSAAVQGRHWEDVDGGARVGAAAERIRTLAASTHTLLERTAGRPAQLGCFGLHEWAMVHRQPTPEVRHPLPLRLGAAATDAVVESMPLRCSHFDAYRFFSPTAAPRNALRPTRATQPDLEQPGCLHATMDLYKWAFQLSPWVPSELVADCFALARRVRLLDMRASPYDLTSLGHDPVAIETPAGRAAYATEQRVFATEAAPLRARLSALAGALAA